jgi:probable phosphoglycerate mutase
MKVYLVRHAQSTQNVMDYQARTSVTEFNEMLRHSAHHPLTPLGVEQARALTQKLSGAPVTRLYSSPFERALMTATIYGESVGLAPVLIDDLREVVPDPLREPRRPTSLRRHYLRSFARMAWTRSGSSWRMEYRRAKRAWEQVTSEPAEAIVAVSHAWTITMILLALRRSPEWRVVRRDVRNAGVSIVERR